MKKNVYISISTNPVEDYEQIVDYAKFLQGKADFLHCDVMDGNFVDAYTYDDSVIKSINANSSIMLDVHLMIEKPEDYYQNYIDAGANMLSVHYEAFQDKNLLMQVVRDIKSQSVLCGLALQKQTPFKEIRPYVYSADLVVIMGVTIGDSGQVFDDTIYDKIREIDTFRNDNALSFKIEVDGGVNGSNAQKMIDCGADILVSGNYVFKAKNKEEAIKSLRC